MARPWPGLPFHRLGRTWRHRWWVPPLAVVCAVLLIVLLQVILEIAALLIALISGFQPDLENGSIFGDPVPDLAFSVMLLSTMTPLVMLVGRLVQRRRVGFLLSVEGRMRWRWAFACLAVGIVPLALSFAVLYTLRLVGGDESSGLIGSGGGEQGVTLAVLVILLFVPLQSSAEEIALRGFVMQAVGSYGAHTWERRGGGLTARALRTPIPAIVISGGVFALLHDYTGWAMLDTMTFGAVMAWLTWYTGGLEAAIGLHVLHNLVVFSFSAVEGTVGSAATGSGSWRGLVATVVEVALYAVVVAWLARRAGVRRTVPDELADKDRPGPGPTLSTRATVPTPGRTARPSPYASGGAPYLYGQASYERNAPQRYEWGSPAPGGWVQPPPGGSHQPPRWYE